MLSETSFNELLFFGKGSFIRIPGVYKQRSLKFEVESVQQTTCPKSFTHERVTFSLRTLLLTTRFRKL